MADVKTFENSILLFLFNYLNCFHLLLPFYKACYNENREFYVKKKKKLYIYILNY